MQIVSLAFGSMAENVQEVVLMDGCYVLYNSFSVILGRWLGDNERLFNHMRCSVALERYMPPAGLELGSLDQ